MCFHCRVKIAKETEAYYSGEIRAGDTFEGVYGFVWDDDCEAGSLRMYVHCSGSRDAKIKTVTINEIRSKAGRRTENETGRLLVPALKELFT